ncbi:MAG: transposon-encoded TnpW family protein [Lachnospiraceae bacterium]|nr:transposon-encoded TnpW family protein [Lachnospiraceae bacterium]
MKETKQYREEGSFFRRIGSTVFKVRVFTDSTEKESAADKIIRLVKNSLLTKQSGCATIWIPQMSRPSERSSA